MVTDKNTKQEILDEYRKLVAEAKSLGKSIPRSASGLNTKNNKADIISAINTLQSIVNSNSDDDLVEILESGIVDKPIVMSKMAKTTPKKDTKISPKKEAFNC